ncbi:MAG: gephyrin-like molybdotransferase Glp [Kofleriaceae bacterium]
MHSVEGALAAVIERVQRLASERVAIREAHGRITAVDRVAPRSLPGFDNSAMDGYAVRAADLPGVFPVVATVGAGQVMQTAVPERAAVRIFTGAPMPAELDTVVIQEDAEAEADHVRLPEQELGANIRKIGEDIAEGELAVPAGTRLGAGALGLCAALGLAELAVVRRPRVAIIATGDELVDVSTVPGPSQIVDSSAHLLPAMIREAGGVATYIGIAKDDPITMAALIASALDHDVVITTGGISVGDRDHVRAALAAAGIELELWKVAMKPGKPFSFGINGRVPVFGLPGNPISTYVAFELFVRPALLAMQGCSAIQRPRVPVSVVRGYRKAAGRTHFIRARVERNGEHLIAHPHPKQGSAMLSSLIGCNALVELPADATEIAPNSLVNAILLEAV